MKKLLLWKREFFLFVCVVLIAAFFRFYLIQEIPPGLYPDEATNGNNAVEALGNGNFKWFYQENNGREGLFINIQALSIAIFGSEPWALRLVSAIFGTLTVIGVWLLANELFASPAIALLSSFFLATSYWHINFSRIGFRAIMVPLLTTFGMYFLLKGLRQGKVIHLFMAGIAIGLGFHTYIAFRFVPFVVLAPLLIYLWRWWKKTGANYCVPCAIAILILGGLIAASPLVIYFAQNLDDFIGRGGQVSIFSTENPLYEFGKSNILTLQMFFWQGDCNGRHNLACQPQLFWPVAVFFIVGFVTVISYLFSATYRLQAVSLITWFLFLLFPATLTWEGVPHALRSIGLITPVFILSGLGAGILWQKGKEYLARNAGDPQWQKSWMQIHRIEKELAVLLSLLLIFITFNTYRDYFLRFANHSETYFSFAVDIRHVGEYINTLPASTKKIVIVNLSGEFIRGVKAPAQTVMFITDTFEEEKRGQKNVEYVHSLSEIILTPNEKTAILPLHSMEKGLIQEIRKIFPALMPKIHGDIISFEN